MQTSVVRVNPGGTGNPMEAISARFAPFPPRRFFISARPSAWKSMIQSRRNREHVFCKGKGLQFFCFFFFPFLFGIFPRFLAEVVLPGICTVLELRSLVCVVLAEFWSLDLSLAATWCLQHFGVWISHSTGICNILELDLSCAWYLPQVDFPLV